MPDVIDLSHPLSPETPVYAVDTPLQVFHTFSHESDGFALSALRLSSHAGTHMDAPRHMLADGKSLDEFPPSRFLGTGVVLDLRGCGPAITAVEVENAVRTGADGLQPGDFALLWTGWDEHFGAPDQFDHPYPSAEAAAYLRDLGVSLVATDACSVDADITDPDVEPDVADYPAHLILMGADILIVENMRGLAQIAGRRMRCAFLPLRVVNAEASPIRALAWTE
jgi:kynurenine formamidase